MLIEKNLAFRTLCFLANLCNSTTIEMCEDIIQVSQRFRGCQMLEYIAEISTGHERNGIDDITSFSDL